MLNRILLGTLLVSSSFAWAGQSVNLAWDASPDPTVVGYSIYYGPAPGNYTNKLDAGSALTLTTPVLADGTYYFSATSRNASGLESDFANVITTNVSTVAVGTAPVVTGQPSSVTATAGTSASFSVSVSGTAPISYQWRFNGADIAGATNATWTIASVQTSNGGTYTCFVSNSFGSVTSTAATLTVLSVTAPSIVSQPSPVTATAGTTATFAVTATGSTPLAYQWLFNGNPISGATAPTYTIGSVQTSNAGTYSCFVSNSAGSATSAGAVLTVNAPVSGVAPTISIQPSDVTCASGTNAAFAVVASGTSLSYRWLRNIVPISDGGNVTGSISANLSLTGVTTADQNNYCVVVSNAWGSVTSRVVLLTVTNAVTNTIVPPSIVTQPSSVTVDAGTSATFAVVASGSTPLGYQWLFNGVVMPGATSSSYTINSAQTSNAGTYTCTVSNSAGTVTSAGAMLTVRTAQTAPSIVSQPASLIVDPSASATFNITATGSTPLAYQWLFNGVAIPGATASSYSINSVQTNNVGSYACSVSNSVGGVVSAGASLAIGTYIVSQPSSQTINATSNLLLNVSVGGTTANTYQWSKNGSPLPAATNSTYAISSALRANAGTYTIAVTGNRTVVSAPAVVTVNDPFFYLQPVSTALVVGQSYTFTAAAVGTSPLSYQWYVVKSGSTPTPLTGKTSTSLTLTSVKKSDAGTYYCVANNGATAQSSNAVLNVVTKTSQLPATMTLAAATSVVPGTYNGLFAPATGMSVENAGLLANLVVNSDGTYSGKLSLAGSQYSIAGTFDSSGSSTVTINRHGKGNVVVVLQGSSTGQPMTGTVSCDMEAWSSPLRANATFYSSSNPNPAPALYNVALLDPVGALLGTASITNNATGTVTTSGTLADSTQFSCGSPISQNGEWPVYVNLYSGTGLLQGWLNLSNGVPAGTILWIKEGSSGLTNALTVTPR